MNGRTARLLARYASHKQLHARDVRKAWKGLTPRQKAASRIAVMREVGMFDRGEANQTGPMQLDDPAIPGC